MSRFVKEKRRKCRERGRHVQLHLAVTMDDATSEHYTMFFVEEEGTASSFAGGREVILSHSLFCSFYSDRSSHYWHTPEAGGKVVRKNRNQFGRAMHLLGIEGHTVVGSGFFIPRSILINNGQT